MDLVLALSGERMMWRMDLVLALSGERMVWRMDLVLAFYEQGMVVWYTDLVFSMGFLVYLDSYQASKYFSSTKQVHRGHVQTT